MKQSFISPDQKHKDTWKYVVNTDNQMDNRGRLFENTGSPLLPEEGPS